MTLAEERNAKLRKEYGIYNDSNMAALITNQRNILTTMATGGKSPMELQKANAKLQDLIDARELLRSKETSKPIPGTASKQASANLKFVKVSSEEKHRINQQWKERTTKKK